MPRPKKTEKIEETSVENISTENTVIEKESSNVEKTVEVEKTVSEPKTESVETVIEKDDFSDLANKLNSEFKKSGDGFTAQVAKVGRNVSYVLIKAINGAYCFARIGSGKEGSRANFEIEFLSNVPSDSRNKISSITDSLSISDSKRLFFHPSGIL